MAWVVIVLILYFFMKHVDSSSTMPQILSPPPGHFHPLLFYRHNSPVSQV